MRIHTGAPTSLKTSSLFPLLIHVGLLRAMLGGWMGAGGDVLPCPAFCLLFALLHVPRAHYTSAWQQWGWRADLPQAGTVRS